MILREVNAVTGENLLKKPIEISPAMLAMLLRAAGGCSVRIEVKPC